MTSRREWRRAGRGCARGIIYADLIGLHNYIYMNAFKNIYFYALYNSINLNIIKSMCDVFDGALDSIRYKSMIVVLEFVVLVLFGGRAGIVVWFFVNRVIFYVDIQLAIHSIVFFVLGNFCLRSLVDRRRI